jgi:single-stranded-DNA-specific exonuclease
VIGIVASRLVERFARPVVLFNINNGCAQGSARSVPGVSIHEALSQAVELFDSFGGHEMAAGMKLASSKVAQLRDRVVDYINKQVDESDLVKTVEIDACTTLDELPLRAFEQIDELAPFGRSNELPTLCVKAARLPRQAEVVGQQGKHLRLTLAQGRRVMNAIAFNMGEHQPLLPGGCEVDVVFQPKLGSYRGQPQAEMHVRDIRRRPPGQNG